MKLRPAVLTKVQTVLWHAPRVSIHVEFTDGTVRDWRVVPETVADGVIVSPAPRTDAEAAAFFSGRPLPIVRSVMVFARPGAYVLDGVTFTRVRRNGPPAAP